MVRLLVIVGVMFVMLMILVHWIGDELGAPSWFWWLYGCIFGAPIGGCIAQFIVHIIEEGF